MKTRFQQSFNRTFSKPFKKRFRTGFFSQHNYLQAQHLFTGTSVFVRDNLEKLGSHIDEINKKRNQTIQYRPADVSQPSLRAQDNPLQAQLLKNYEHIRSPHFHHRSKFFATLIPNDNLDTIIEMLFEQIGLTAESWSQQDILGERRFADLANKSDLERCNLAWQIANQNRSLATLGGATNFLGLAGLFVDSLWLLLVSLRTIYQIAEIHGQPLTGKEGIQTAYSVLASCRLEKIADKQQLLAILAVASRMLINTEHQGLQHALKVEVKNDKNIAEFTDYIDELLTKTNIDIDSINLAVIGKSLPFIATTIGVHFNSILIEEVIGVATATFAPDIKIVAIDA